MKQIQIGTRLEGDKKGEPAWIVLETLIGTRLFIYAGSGGGKSWLIRRLLEQSYEYVQQIIIDVKGEFFTLRRDYVYMLAVGLTKDRTDAENQQHLQDSRADLPVTVEGAATLAQTLMHARTSAIVDISAMNEDEQVDFVNNFTQALLRTPHKDRHHVLYVIDEVHNFCNDAETIRSTKALKRLAKEARTYGICPIYATQSIQDVNKRAIGQLFNKFVGKASLDVDKARAATVLGFKKDRQQEIEDLEPGEFFCYGDAISKRPIKVKVGDVKTPHPKVGEHIEPPQPMTNDAMKDLVRQLQAIAAASTAKAEEQASDKSEQKDEISPPRTGEKGHQSRDEHTREGVSWETYDKLRAQLADTEAKLAESEKQRKFYETLHGEVQEELRKQVEINRQLEQEVSKIDAVKDALRELFGGPMRRVDEQAGLVNVDEVMADIAVREVREPANFEPGSVAANVCSLVADGFFREAPRNLKDVHVEYARHWPLAKRHHPDDSKHSAAWRKEKLKPVLDMLAQRRYQVLIKDGEVYVEGPNKVKREVVTA